MGIKGIYGEIGHGHRVALAKLAIDNFEQTGRPLRIAIDISIWQFQIQSGKGGSNPALRTLYYRLLRLLSMAIQPLFVFDGPHKPPFKRNKRTTSGQGSSSNILTKQMLQLFGFPFHIAPGEAEAECALLQRESIVDAVLSEDVDTLMFGCGMTFRNWSSEGPRGNHAPTHVSVYDAEATKQGRSGLDREGMILVALMSGGDYVTEGIPGCGIKVACEAARAGYGKSLCSLSKTNKAGFDTWRQKLVHELQGNESKQFRTKHRSLNIPVTFPDMEILSYYTHPVVSSVSKLAKLKEDIRWDKNVDITGLRSFVAEAFEWTNKIGATKFVRGLAPVLLVTKLLARGNRRASGYNDVVLTAINEMELVRAIGGKRNHFSTDGIPELRLVYQPLDIVPIDLDAEYDDNDDYGRDGLAPTGDDGDVEAFESAEGQDSRERSQSPEKRLISMYDATKPDKAWVLETIAKIGIPLKVEDYEESLRNPRKKLQKVRSGAKKAVTLGGMPRGALDKYMTTSKPRVGTKGLQSSTRDVVNEPVLPPSLSAHVIDKNLIRKSSRINGSQGDNHSLSEPWKGIRPVRSNPLARSQATKGTLSRPRNPWDLTQMSSSPISQVGITKASLHGRRCVGSPQKKTLHQDEMHEVEDLSSSYNSPAVKRLSRHDSRILISSSPQEQIESSPISRESPSPRKKRSPALLSKLQRSQPALTCEGSSLPQSHNESEATSGRLFLESDDIKSNLNQFPSSPDTNFPALEDLFTPTKVREAIVAGHSPQNESTTKSLIQNKEVHDVLSSSPTEDEESAKDLLLADTSADVFRSDEKSMGAKGKVRRFLQLRQSLEGSWKEIQEDGLNPSQKGRRSGPRRAWRMSEVEVLDLTGD